MPSLVDRGSKKMGVVVICHEAELRRQLMKGLLAQGARAFEAESRADGMPLIYQTRPDLIFLQVDPCRENSWETLFRIRLVTDTPCVLLADQPHIPGFQSFGEHNVLVLLQPFTISQAIARAKAFWKRSKTTTSTSHWAVPLSTNSVPETHSLRPHEVLAIDRALQEVGQQGQVRLIISQGQLRFLAKLKLRSLHTGAVAEDMVKN